MIYALYPECEVSVHVMPGLRAPNTVLAMRKSILRRGNRADLGEVGLRCGGGCHAAAATCQAEYEDSDRIIAELNSASVDHDTEIDQRVLA